MCAREAVMRGASRRSGTMDKRLCILCKLHITIIQLPMRGFLFSQGSILFHFGELQRRKLLCYDCKMTFYKFLMLQTAGNTKQNTKWMQSNCRICVCVYVCVTRMQTICFAELLLAVGGEDLLNVGAVVHFILFGSYAVKVSQNVPTLSERWLSVFVCVCVYLPACLVGVWVCVCVHSCTCLLP